MRHGKEASTDHICHIITLESVQKHGDVSTVTHYLEIRELKQALTVGGSKENTRGRKMGEKEGQKKTVGFGVGTMSQKRKQQKTLGGREFACCTFNSQYASVTSMN